MTTFVVKILVLDVFLVVFYVVGFIPFLVIIVFFFCSFEFPSTISTFSLSISAPQLLLFLHLLISLSPFILCPHSSAVGHCCALFYTFVSPCGYSLVGLSCCYHISLLVFFLFINLPVSFNLRSA